VIDASVKKVFAFMAEPNNLPEIRPSLVEVPNVQPLPSGGYSYGWTYSLAGLRFEGHAE
jgi:hypothetical protein